MGDFFGIYHVVLSAKDKFYCTIVLDIFKNNYLISKLNDLISLPPFLITFSSLITISLFFSPNQHDMEKKNDMALFILMICIIIHIKFDIDIK
jgi:hypothetical protein